MNIRQSKDGGLIMVDSLKIAMMIVSLILVILIPVYAFMRLRRAPEVSQVILWGILGFLLFGVIRTLLLLVVNNLLFPGPSAGVVSDVLLKKPFLAGFINAFVGAIALIASITVSYKFQLKKLKNPELPIVNSLVFNLMSSMTLISQLLQYILISFNANKGNLAKYVSEETSIEAIKEFVNSINKIPAISYLEIGLSRWFEAVIFMVAFTFVYKYMKKDKEERDIKYMFMAFALVFVYIMLGALTITVFKDQAVLDVGVKALFVLIVYLAFNQYEKNKVN